MNFSKWPVVLLIGVLFLLTGCGKKEEAVTGLDIKVKETPPISFCYVENVGPYDAIGARFAEIADLAEAHQLRGNVIGVFFSDPEKVPAEELRCELGIEVPAEFEAPEGFKLREIPARTVACSIMKGPYEKIVQEYKKIFVWAGKNDYQIAGPLMEIYLKGGPEVPPEEYLTEVCLPIKKRGEA